MKPIIGIVMFLLFVSCLETAAQEFRITQLKMGAMGSLEWSSGSTVSKNGVVVKFQTNLDKTGGIVSYSHEKAGIDALKAGDRIALYLTRIKVTGSGLNFRDDAGEKVIAVHGRPGGWRIVTIESVTQTPAGATIRIKEKLNLEKVKSVSEFSFQLKNGYLTDITAN